MKAAKSIAKCMQELRRAGNFLITIELLQTSLEKYGHYLKKLEDHIRHNNTCIKSFLSLSSYHSLY